MLKLNKLHKGINTNIFLAIEQYLAEPTEELAKTIAELSNQIDTEIFLDFKKETKSRIRNYEFWKVTDEMYLQDFALAKIENQDNYLCRVHDKLNELAKEALPYSVRLFERNQTATDPKYIFRVTKEQAEKIAFLQLKMAKDVINFTYPHKGTFERFSTNGLNGAFADYIQRKADSGFDYCKGSVASIYDQTVLLHQKAKKLAEKEHDNASKILVDTCSQIKLILETCVSSDDGGHTKTIQNNLPNLKDRLPDIIKILNNAQKDPEIQQHRGVKKILMNFLLCLSVLGAICIYVNTGSLFYRPQTKTEEQLKKFSAQITATLNNMG